MNSNQEIDSATAVLFPDSPREQQGVQKGLVMTAVNLEKAYDRLQIELVWICVKDVPEA